MSAVIGMSARMETWRAPGGARQAEGHFRPAGAYLKTFFRQNPPCFMRVKRIIV